MPHFGNANVIEIVWSIGAVVSLFAISWTWLDARADRQFLRDAGLNGRREIVATWHVALNGSLMYICVAFVVAGVVAMISPEPHAKGLIIFRSFVQISFLSSQPMLLRIAFGARRYRARLLATRRILNVSPDVDERDDGEPETASVLPET